MSKTLDYIATTPVWNRLSVMPRIYCRDGVSLSVQASKDHDGARLIGAGSRNGGPWRTLEVAYIAGCVPPDDWQSKVSSHREKHNVAGMEASIQPSMSMFAYVVPVEDIRLFIESHGGELPEIERVRQMADAKYLALKDAQRAEREAWDLVSSGVQDAESLFLNLVRSNYDQLLKVSHQLFDEWIELMNRGDELRKKELAELEAAAAQAKP